MTRTRSALSLIALFLVALFALPARAEELPIAVVDIRNLPVTGAAPVLTSSITGGSTAYPVKAYRVQVWVVGTDSLFNLDLGTDLAPAAFNGSSGALVAARVYTFVFEATSADEINFTFTTTTTIGRLTVTEIRAGVM